MLPSAGRTTQCLKAAFQLKYFPMLWVWFWLMCSPSRPQGQQIIAPPAPDPNRPTSSHGRTDRLRTGLTHHGPRPNPSCELALTSSQYHGTITVHETTCAHARTGNSSLNKGSNYGPTTEIHLSTRIIGCCISCREFTLRVRPCMIAGDGGLMVVC